MTTITEPAQVEDVAAAPEVPPRCEMRVTPPRFCGELPVQALLALARATAGAVTPQCGRQARWSTLSSCACTDQVATLVCGGHLDALEQGMINCYGCGRPAQLILATECPR